MTTANEEFGDLMPHRIRVTNGSGYDDYGRPIPGTSYRHYRCLIDDTTSTVRNASGEEIDVALTAYVAPVPVESTDGTPVDIESNEGVEILTPRKQTLPVKSIERHYDAEDGEGMLHNIVLRF